jgi:hypothetical protein
LVLRLLKDDLLNMRDSAARARGAIKVLEQLGYVVKLEKRLSPAAKPHNPALKLVQSNEPEDEDPPPAA